MHVWKICASGSFLIRTGDALLPLFLNGGMVGIESRSISIIYSEKSYNNAQEVYSYARDYITTL